MMRNLMKGALSGAVATAAMSAVMLAGSRLGLMGDQPPKRIVRAALPGRKHRPKPGEGVLGALAHFGFGMTAGALLGLLARGHRVPATAGAGYALTIWIASYEGWIPSRDILPPISEDRPGRPFVMGVGHVVYGTTLTWTLNRLNARHRAEDRAPGPRPVPTGRTVAPTRPTTTPIDA